MIRIRAWMKPRGSMVCWSVLPSSRALAWMSARKALQPQGKNRHGPDGGRNHEQVHQPGGKEMGMDDLVPARGEIQKAGDQPHDDKRRWRECPAAKAAFWDRSRPWPRTWGCRTRRWCTSAVRPARPPAWRPRGHRVVQSPQLWQSQISALPTRRSLSPQDAAIISFLGNGLFSGEIGQATEQVAHWKHFFRSPPPRLATSLINPTSGSTTYVSAI